MANVKAKLKSKLTGDVYFVETLAELVTNAQGDTLENVEAGAQVNTIEGVQVNGTDLTPDSNKKVNVVIPAAVEYTIEKLATPTSGYVASYQLCADGTGIAGSIVDIPKDYLVKSASMGICEEAGVPATVPALAVGDPYLDFVINTKDSSATDEHIYINVKGLVDIYTAGNGIDIVNNVVSVDTTDTSIVDAAPTASSTKFVQSGGVYSALADKVDANTAITGATKCKITYDAKGLVTGGADLAESDIPSLSLSKISDVTATASEVNVLDGITASTDELNILDGATLTTTELNYVDGVTSNIQTQLNAKQATITGAASSIVSSDLTASKAVVSDANGKVAASSVTTTELGLLSGMTDMLVIEPITA